MIFPLEHISILFHVLCGFLTGVQNLLGLKGNPLVNFGEWRREMPTTLI